MEVTFNAIVREVKVKALMSLDKGYQVIIQGENTEMSKLVDAPADGEVKVTISW